MIQIFFMRNDVKIVFLANKIMQLIIKMKTDCEMRYNFFYLFRDVKMNKLILNH